MNKLKTTTKKVTVLTADEDVENCKSHSLWVEV